MLLKLIPSDLVLHYNKLQQKDSGSDIQQLLSFLTQSLTAREQTYTTNKSSFELCNRRHEMKSNFSPEPRSYKQQNQKSFHTASELLAAPVKENKNKINLICIFCDSMTHNSNECEYVINMSVEERKNILLRKGACFNCLKISKHLSRNCPNNKTKCEICSGLHHKFFCFKQQKRELGSMSTDLANQNTGDVFLQTLAVFIEKGNSKQLVKAMLATGSQKSYISEYAAKFIGLKSIGKETITPRTFWRTQNDRKNSLLVHSLLTNREKISDLWELYSLGINDPSEKKSKLELQDLALKHFENTVLRDDEGIQDLKVPRRLSNLDLKDTNLSLQVFCDASKLSYATCVFLRAEREGEVTCQLIQARSKVAPLKGTSILRLELLASMIGARIADSVKKDLHMENVDVTYWSDSMDALHWIKRDGPWATFVANRGEEIRRLCSKENWRYVSGMQNPADLPSRGRSVKTLKKVRWWEGPSWLKNSTEDWPKSDPRLQNTRYLTKKKGITLSS
ncbi:transposon Ty3-G Gag-Pol polyprotein [Trichonephila inaurata madagascariensis]|uniref:Transposon Ty3-G Gag-Pol polyprotein n=1 Tax=Trichonephila inaurata madagascariensis TaxID=2747483 RepID=A0A8X7BSM3_9ARAC|nr:transposon Ty3-G Gag-Pol polyprotein [Trichonephila inaurata madagascariensis]